MAGALKDNLRGIVVGETTFGKGLIQTIVELSDGSGVAVTVARYQTPEGTDINKKGIQPDIVISTGMLALFTVANLIHLACSFENLLSTISGASIVA